MRYIEEVVVEKAIIHVLDLNGDEPLLNQAEMELDEDLYLFIAKHIVKALSDESNAKGVFINPQAPFYSYMTNILGDDADFIEESKDIASYLFKIMKNNSGTSSADLITCIFASGDEKFLGLLKLDYQTNFTHSVEFVDNAFRINLVNNSLALPNIKQRLTKCAFMKMPGQGDFDLVYIDRLEKNESGEVLDYFTKQFLQVSNVYDNTDQTKIIKDNAEKWIRKNLKEEIGKAIEVREKLNDRLVNGADIDILDFSCDMIDNIEERERFLMGLEKKGVDTDEKLEIDKKWVEKKMKSKTIKTDTGFTIRGDFENFEDERQFEIQYNGDGTVNYIIKHVRNVSER